MTIKRRKIDTVSDRQAELPNHLFSEKRFNPKKAATKDVRKVFNKHEDALIESIRKAK